MQEKTAPLGEVDEDLIPPSYFRFENLERKKFKNSKKMGENVDKSNPFPKHGIFFPDIP